MEAWLTDGIRIRSCRTAEWCPMPSFSSISRAPRAPQGRSSGDKDVVLSSPPGTFADAVASHRRAKRMEATASANVPGGERALALGGGEPWSFGRGTSFVRPQGAGAIRRFGRGTTQRTSSLTQSFGHGQAHRGLESDVRAPDVERARRPAASAPDGVTAARGPPTTAPRTAGTQRRARRSQRPSSPRWWRCSRGPASPGRTGG